MANNTAALLARWGNKTQEERFWAKVQKTNDCWLWIGTRNPEGYGLLFVSKGKSPTRAHRFSYELLRGPIPVGLELDHLCRVRACVNPDHLEPVTRSENMRRGVGYGDWNKRKTQCRNGHPYDLINTYVTSTGERHCRICSRENTRAYRQRNAS